MTNADFRLLVESLGFYNAESIRDHLRHTKLDETVALRPIQYWLNGKSTALSFHIPEDIVTYFLNLEQRKIDLSNKELFINNHFLFKDKYLMWEKFHVLDGLPCTFLNQLMMLVNILHGHRELHYCTSY